MAISFSVTVQVDEAPSDATDPKNAPRAVGRVTVSLQKPSGERTRWLAFEPVHGRPPAAAQFGGCCT